MLERTRINKCVNVLPISKSAWTFSPLVIRTISQLSVSVERLRNENDISNRAWGVIMWERLRNKPGLKPEQLQGEFNSLFSELISFAIYLGIPVKEESMAQPFWSQDSVFALLEDRQLSVPLL